MSDQDGRWPWFERQALRNREGLIGRGEERVMKPTIEERPGLGSTYVWM